MAEGRGRHELAHELQRACAIAHGPSAKMSLNQLVMLVLEKGLPARVERERVLAERLAAAESVPADGAS